MTSPWSLCLTTANVGQNNMLFSDCTYRMSYGNQTSATDLCYTAHCASPAYHSPIMRQQSKWECHSKLTRYGATIPTMRCTYFVAHFRSKGREHVFSAHLRQVRASLTYVCAAAVADFHIGGRVRAQRACRKVLWNHCLCQCDD